MSWTPDHIGSEINYSHFPLVDREVAIPRKRDRELKACLKKLKLKGVTLTHVQGRPSELGKGSYGTVFKAECKGAPCAAKQLDYDPLHVKQPLVYNFQDECLRHSKLDHPNIVKMLGVFYPKNQTVPLLVMELMEQNLTQLLEKNPNIIMYVKLSILQDVSRGLCYLHTQNIVHQALYSDNILFTKGLIAKIGDFKTGAETVSEPALLSVRWDTKINDFLPDSRDDLKFDLPLNVFSFGCVACHVITQKCPSSNPGNHHKDFIKSEGVRNKKHQIYADEINDSYLSSGSMFGK